MSPCGRKQNRHRQKQRGDEELSSGAKMRWVLASRGLVSFSFSSFTKRDELVLKREVLSGQDLLKIAAERSEESEGKMREGKKRHRRTHHLRLGSQILLLQSLHKQLSFL
jgi:hypothetical protein